MLKRKLPNRFAAAASIGVGALTIAMTLGATSASASLPIPPVPALNTYPTFFNGNVDPIRGSGSDTTFYMMQDLSDLYTGAGLYGCVLNSDEATCNESGNQNGPTTDITDNYDRNEVTEGVDDVGSGAGQGQLCTTTAKPSSLSVNFARSSKPASAPSGCVGALVQAGYAKDGVPAIDFPTTNPGLLGSVNTTTGSGGENLPWAAAASGSANEAANGGNPEIGPVADGWLPGDSIHCTPNTADTSPTPSGDCSGYPLTNITNNDSGGGASSVAYRLWCATDSTRITDWGQLTNLAASGPGNGGSSKTLGNGSPIGIPVRIVGVNTSSGTNATFSSFAQSGDGSGNCTSSSGGNFTDINADNDPNSLTAPSPNSAVKTVLENNASQIGDYAGADFSYSDPADQAVEIATSLYFMSYGVYSTNDYANTTAVEGSGGSVLDSYLANPLEENGVAVGPVPDLGNTYPTARTLFNIWDTSTVDSSTADFINWICDSNNMIAKGKDNSTGQNFDAEVKTVIQNDFGFSRLTDQTSEESTLAKVTPGDNQPAPNASCAASSAGMTTGSSNPTVTIANNGTGGTATATLSSGDWPAATIIPNGTTVEDKTPTGLTVGLGVLPGGTTVTGGQGSATLDLSSIATGTGSGDTLTFPGLAPVTEVAVSGS